MSTPKGKSLFSFHTTPTFTDSTHFSTLFFLLRQHNGALFCLLRGDRWLRVQDRHGDHKEGGPAPGGGAGSGGPAAHPGESELCPP